METQKQELVRIEDLRIYFGREEQPVRAVDGVSLSLRAGEFLAFAGESGCGKSVLAYALTGLLPAAARQIGGRVLVKGREVAPMSARELRALRGGTIAYVFQEPGRSLNPVMRVGEQIAEAVRRHQKAPSVRAEVIRLLGQVGIPDAQEKAQAYPHQLSGGMQQRVMIAMALACRPALLIADEPTTALDVTIQAQVIELLQELNRSLGMAVWLITHNLGLVRGVAERLFVMYAGVVVEEGPTDEVLASPRHPYTRALLASIPPLSGGTDRLCSIPGAVPAPNQWPTGCRFHPRCTAVLDVCRTTEPALTECGSHRRVACCLNGY